jgi:radical SAM-linked protein
VQRLRIRYAKRGRLRFTSHRDFQRAFERALRRAAVPMAYSAGFSPHPKVSYAGAAPTGVASEAEYLEIGLATAVDPDDLRNQLDSALPAGLDVMEVHEATGPPLADRLQVSHWEILIHQVTAAEAAAAVRTFLAADSIQVERLTKQGLRTLEARVPVLDMKIVETPRSTHGKAESGPCATIDMVVRHTTPAVRPDDVLAGLGQVAGLAPPAPPLVTRLAQGQLDAETGTVTDPLHRDQRTVSTADETLNG